MREIRIIALDLDGTLLDSDKQLPAENLEALQLAAAQCKLTVDIGRLVSALFAVGVHDRLSRESAR